MVFVIIFFFILDRHLNEPVWWVVASVVHIVKQV